MYQTYSSIRYGEAYICVNRNRVKQYSGDIYLQDKQEFEIELFNPSTVTKLAVISINGTPISNSGIVVKPGSRVYLERFLDTANKFVFETYTVENTLESLRATRNNGAVQIAFYDEETPKPPAYNPGTIYYRSNSDYPELRSSKMSLTGGATTDNCSFTTTSCSSTVNTSFVQPEVTVDAMETGRIEQGGASSQRFQQYNGKFKSYVTNYVTFKLLPASAKPLEVSDLAIYCVNCGTKNKKGNYKYCPKCGNKY